MEIHNGYQHQWRCDNCRKIRANCLCLTFRAIHVCIKCWFKLKNTIGLENNTGLEIFLNQFKKKLDRPLYKQKWFREMVDRIMRGEKLGQYIETPFCDHHNGCKHRESFHAYDIPSNGGHVRKSEVWEFILWNGHVQTLGRFE